MQFERELAKVSQVGTFDLGSGQSVRHVVEDHLQLIGRRQFSGPRFLCGDLKFIQGHGRPPQRRGERCGIAPTP